MRLSLRKVVKYSTFLMLFFILNIWVSYNVNLWSFQNSHEYQKVRKSLVPFHNLNVNTNGGEENTNDVPFEGYEDANDIFDTLTNFRGQRSAKSLSFYIDSSVNSGRNALGYQNKNRPVPVQQVGEKSVASGKGPNQLVKDNSERVTDLDDIFISVKTTLKYHESRVRLLLKTWFRLAAQQTYFFTDGDDKYLAGVLGEHLVNTNCSTDHSRRALSCKMAMEVDAFMASRKRWFCHVDDDVYVNIPQLTDMLKKYDHKKDWYLGKPSLKHPLEVADRDNPGLKLTFWFATGGAGFCISRSLALKMAPYASGGRFMTTAEKIRLPDDCTLGYIIEYLLRRELTIVPEFHSHLENLWLIKRNMLKKQVTYSFSDYSGRNNVVDVPGFTSQEDPTRFLSLHCFLFPNFKLCELIQKKAKSRLVVKPTTT